MTKTQQYKNKKRTKYVMDTPDKNFVRKAIFPFLSKKIHASICTDPIVVVTPKKI